MEFPVQIPVPLMFSPIKHYFQYIVDFINLKSEREKFPGSGSFIKELKHLGTRVMDIYYGQLSTDQIFTEIIQYLESINISEKHSFRKWVGMSLHSFKIIRLSDTSQWTLKYFDDKDRYVHIFPARLSPHSFRVKANTLKSAILYLVLIGKDFITEKDLNKTRIIAGLSPIKNIVDVEAITEMIEILRNNYTGSRTSNPFYQSY
jgi:hypothetical protein